MKHHVWLWIACISANILNVSLAAADVTVSAPIGDDMVLQRDMKVPVWGKADPGQKVTVKFRGQTRSAVTSRNGVWKVRLHPLQAGGPYTMTIRGSNTIVLKNILVGEVWLASGQSNMAFQVQGCLNAGEELAAAQYPQIRFLSVERVNTASPSRELKNAHWAVCAPQTVHALSGVAYFFGRKLHQDLKVPIGLIDSSWGATSAETWTPAESLKGHPFLQQLARCEKPGEFNGPAATYNGMIYPLIPHAIRGVIWYQGEGNVGHGENYSILLSALIKGWRRAWGQGCFPFLIVQLANYGERSPEPTNEAWAHLRAAQAKTVREVKNTALTVAIDVGDAVDIHPRNKQAVGYRLALVAERLVYGWDIPYSGPVYRSMKKDGKKIRIQFTHADKGLLAKGDRLEGFAIAGADKKFVWAQARIEGDAVVVWSKDVPRPVAVRYAWDCNPAATLYNGADLPAVPFRTDKW